jgi:hypothetical protein
MMPGARSQEGNPWHAQSEVGMVAGANPEQALIGLWDKLGTLREC